jgi:hypothetical protein
MELLVCNYFQFPVTRALLGPNNPLRTLFPSTLSLPSSLNVRDRRPISKLGNIVIRLFLQNDAHLFRVVNCISYFSIVLSQGMSVRVYVLSCT